MRWLVRTPLPRIPGYDVAGTLLDPAPGLPVGASVYGMIQAHAGGACAEVARLRPDWLAPAPENLSFAQAASLPLAGMTALQGLRDELGIRPGESVLLNGASGGVGTLAVQIGRILGAEVTAVCSERDRELVTELGAHQVIDYQTERVEDARGFDAIFDIYGSLPWTKARPMLNRGGRYCTTIPSPGAFARGLLARARLHPARLVVVRSRRADLEWLTHHVERQTLRPRVDRVVPLAESHEGHAYLETRRARGKIVVTVNLRS